MKVVWSPQAREDMLDIYRRIACDNPRAARLLHGNISACVTLLSEMPHMGRPGRVAGTRELVIAGTRYIVPYRADGNSIQILRVYHTSRLWPKSF